MRNWLRKKLSHAGGPFLIVALFAFVFCAGVFLATLTPSYRECDSNEQSQAGQHEHASALYQSGTLIYCEGVFAEANNGAITAVATALLTLVTIILVWLAYEQGHTDRAQLRAYVLVEGSNVYDASRIGLQATQPNTLFPQWKGYPGVDLAIRNSGQTPAQRVIHWAEITISNAMDEDKLVPPAVMTDEQFSVIGANTAISKTLLLLPFPLAEPVLSEILNGTKGIYIYGKITYEDVFGASHVSQYRLRYTGVWPPIPFGNFMFCLHGNSFD